jgi:hypothetical protein
MPREETKQAKSWAEVKVGLNSIDKAYAALPAPPVPRDSWSEKTNQLHRCLEGMREQLRSELEQEDLRNQQDDDDA